MTSCFSIKQIILTSERHVEHQIAGRNTQQEIYRFTHLDLCYLVTILLIFIEK